MRTFSMFCFSRLAATVLVAASIIPAFTTSALAKSGFAIVRLSPTQFVANCQSAGGTSSTAPGGGIRCKLPGGTVYDCSSMGGGEMVCQWNRTLPEGGAKQLIGDPLPNRALPDKTPGAPKLPAAPDTVN
ncbi:MAG: hypothetical protein IPK59_10790 [Rhodospirillaceae bacterium]|nr:hypothetical protein [Rhodospirillaceae bacterium]